jgi:hypothetical protein
MSSTRIFDESKGYDPITSLGTFTDCTVVKRENRWWMFGSGFDKTVPDLNVFSASLPENAPLSATGWKITTESNNPAKAVAIAGKSASYKWDGVGGRHCPSYVRGYDPVKKAWVERIYYAGASQNFWGPYAIGYLEWDGGRWIEQPQSAFIANEEWEHGSVYEPNLIFHEGKWRMWYVAGSNDEDYLVQGYAESPNGQTEWSKHEIFFAAQEKVFDFCVTETKTGFEAVFSRVNVKGRTDLPKTGLWWCQAKKPSAKVSDWSEPIRVWPAGPWKPVLRYSETDSGKMLIFCNGIVINYANKDSPFGFTVDCIETSRPA